MLRKVTAWNCSIGLSTQLAYRKKHIDENGAKSDRWYNHMLKVVKVWGIIKASSYKCPKCLLSTLIFFTEEYKCQHFSNNPTI